MLPANNLLRPMKRTEEGGDRMTDYEIFMVFLTIIGLMLKAFDMMNTRK